MDLVITFIDFFSQYVSCFSLSPCRNKLRTPRQALEWLVRKYRSWNRTGGIYYLSLSRRNDFRRKFVNSLSDRWKVAIPPSQMFRYVLYFGQIQSMPGVKSYQKLFIIIYLQLYQYFIIQLHALYHKLPKEK